MILIYKRECVLTLLLGLAVCCPVVAASSDHQYTVRVNPELTTLEITAELATPVTRIGARANAASGYIDNLETCDGDELRSTGRRIIASGSGVQCFRYTVDLRAAAKSERRNRSLGDDSTLVSPSNWLWRPWPSNGQNLVIDFELPDGVLVSPPWELIDDSEQRYRVSPSPESASGAVAFGRFVTAEREIPGATLRIAVMTRRAGKTIDALIDWVESAATNVTLAYGRFPNPAPHIVLIPLGGDGSPVPFGRVIRDGGETAELFVNERAPIASFYDDWTATHEFSHLLLPYIAYRQRWISEGFAQYQQNILLARAGQYTPERAWQKLYEGFERGRRSSPGMSPNRAARERPRGSTMKIYWSGAVLALMADVELRKRSNGRQSLYTVLESLGDCCLPSARTWSGPELFAKLDELAGDDVFMPLYRRFADSGEFPDYRPVFAELGIEIRDGRIEFNDNAPLTSARIAMTTR